MIEDINNEEEKVSEGTKRMEGGSRRRIPSFVTQTDLGQIKNIMPCTAQASNDIAMDIFSSKDFDHYFLHENTRTSSP